jgi:gamma-glutamyltranspeptidase/glutathione hydrolase
MEPTGQQLGHPGELHLESGVPDATRKALAAIGWPLGDNPGGYGGYQAIMRDFDNGTWIAATEMRKDGSADGY